MRFFSLVALFSVFVAAQSFEADDSLATFDEALALDASFDQAPELAQYDEGEDEGRKKRRRHRRHHRKHHRRHRRHRKKEMEAPAAAAAEFESAEEFYAGSPEVDEAAFDESEVAEFDEAPEMAQYDGEE
ncbi:hypothetical protein HDU91_000594, partial [Kappamyces sp. JEL0680]